MQIVMRLKDEPSAEGKGGRGVERPFARVEQALGLQVVPMHPGTNDPELRRYFSLDVPDRGTAERALALLRREPSVDSAYLKPEDEPP